MIIGTTIEITIEKIEMITEMKTGAIGMSGEVAGLRDKIVVLLKVIKGIGIARVVIKAATGLSAIMTALTEAMEGRTINLESLQPLKALYLRVQSRIRKSIGMKKNAGLARREINVPERISSMKRKKRR